MENKWLDPVVEAYREYFGGTAENIFDIGTRDGDDAEMLREHLNVLAENVYAIDANPLAIMKTRQAYPLFNLYKNGVSDTEGTMKFLQVHGDKDAEGTSSLDIGKMRDPFFAERSTVIEIPVVRMDTLLRTIGKLGDPISVVKVDVESYTMECLLGFGSALDDVEVFHLETERAYDREGHVNNLGVAKFMREHGFFLVDVSYEWGDGIQDQVWVNLSLADKQPSVPETDER